MRPPLSGLILFNYSLVGFTKLHMFKRTWEEEKDWASASICFLVEKETDNCVSFAFFSSVSPPSHYRPLPSLFAPPSTWMLKLLSVVSHTSPCQLMLALCYSIPLPPVPSVLSPSFCNINSSNGRHWRHPMYSVDTDKGVIDYVGCVTVVCLQEKF